MKVSVDRDRCTGHGRCYALAPDLFEPEDIGHCVQRGTTFDIRPEQEDAARMAETNCPESAISVG